MDFLDTHQTTITNVVTALLVVLLTWVAVAISRRAVDRFVARRNLSADPAAHTRFRMLERLLTAALIFVGFGLALYLLDIAALRRVAVGMFASVGFLGIVIGLAAQTTVANLVAGVVLAFVQPLRLGDRVHVADELGVVEEIGLFYTQIRTWDNRRLLIPNKLLSNEVIKNYTVRDPRMPGSVVFRLADPTRIAEARDLLLEVARSQPLLITPPVPRVDLVDTDDKGALLRLVAWACGHDESWHLALRMGEEGLARLSAAGIDTSAYRLETEGPFAEEDGPPEAATGADEGEP
jgi:small-conductance mechanosensitive channel